MTGAYPDAVPVLRELADLKRIRVAGASGSLADQAFLRSWSRLSRGDALTRVAGEECAQALAAARLGGVDATVLADAGLLPEEILEVLSRAFDSLGLELPGAGDLRRFLTPDRLAVLPQPPEFARLLALQPRAGATYPGRPRVVVEPPESHGDHCFVTAVFAALLAPSYGAVAEEAFLLGLAHHLHNARMPDSGFAGEELLGAALPRVMATLTRASLRELPPALAAHVHALLPARDDADSELGQAFHAADVLDRVLQVHHHARAAAFTAAQALVDLDIVHPGPVQGFQLEVLAACGLAA